VRCSLTLRPVLSEWLPCRQEWIPHVEIEFLALNSSKGWKQVRIGGHGHTSHIYFSFSTFKDSKQNVQNILRHHYPHIMNAPFLHHHSTAKKSTDSPSPIPTSYPPPLPPFLRCRSRSHTHCHALPLHLLHSCRPNPSL
jgi:hypothetical protein